MRPTTLALFFAASCCLSISASAIVRCEMNGKSVNPNNGNETAGLTGLLRCKDEDSGKLQREQELRNGKYIGLERFFDRDGRLLKERNVNERGNSQGVVKQFWPNGKLKSEENANNGESQGVVRQFYETGNLRRLSYMQERREVLEISFNPDGSYNDLRCHTTSLISEDRKPCGFAGKAETVLQSASGSKQSLLTWEQGKLLAIVFYRDNGEMESDMRFDQGRRVHRSYFTDNKPDGKARPREERIFEAGDQFLRSSRGPLLSHKQWGSNGQLTLFTRYADGKPTLTERWYLNGALKEKSTLTGNGSTTRTLRENYTDDGKLNSRETLTAEGNITGLQQVYYNNGKPMREDTYGEPDSRGRSRLVKRKEWDESGKVVADDEILEDGSRKR